jgi:hypothetical protein
MSRSDPIEELEAEIACLRAEVDAKSAEIVELQTELHRVRPIADQIDGLRAELECLKACFFH